MIKIAIATNNEFKDKTLPIIIPSLISGGFLPDEITIFNAGCLSRGEHKYNSSTDLIDLDHNSFEYSALIDIVESKLDNEYWFLLHDTCKVGPKFKSLIYNMPGTIPPKIALKHFPSMSIGLYRYDYLCSVADKLLSIKNKDYSDAALDRWKEWGVANEDFILWKTDPEPACYSKPGRQDRFRTLDYKNWYGTGSVRRTEYYPALDLYKNKSNWGQSKILKRKV